MLHKIDIKQFLVRHLLVIVLCTFLFGVAVGCLIGYKVYRWRMTEAIAVGGFLFDSKIYEIKEKKINGKE